MAKFRKRPVVVEAVQLQWYTWQEMCEHADVGRLADGRPEGCFVTADGKVAVNKGNEQTIGLLIPTLEGTMLGVQGDWIIRGVNNELYPCKPDIFEKTYEPV